MVERIGIGRSKVNEPDARVSWRRLALVLAGQTTIDRLACGSTTGTGPAATPGPLLSTRSMSSSVLGSALWPATIAARRPYDLEIRQSLLLRAFLELPPPCGRRSSDLAR